MKTIFITGASSGLGKATAKLLASKGWNVIATMRHPEKETELNHIKNIHILPLDVTDLSSIEKVVAAAVQIGPVDVVFNNAGYGLTGPLEGYKDEQVTRQFNTNVFGSYPGNRSFSSSFKGKTKWLNYQHNFYRRIGRISFFFHLPCYEMGC
ncbi:SDR family NAD(P)-dependent oxidoreductase [Chryseobacterium geocarposphaerae]|uniref:SDR family NAD(P)-dependent oxidoreductase n=1 Tax=Chryseobacterium geocarposphaerae TaxID=1416776 RepID=UPI003742E390